MSTVSLRPLRFTDDVAAMRAFAELLGLRSRVESERGGWVDLIAGDGGMLALHDAANSDTGSRPGHTVLSYECSDADALAERLRAGGFGDAVVYDETYGRVLTVTDADGGSVQLDERQDDSHGYRRNDDPDVDPRWSLRPELTCTDLPGQQRFLALFDADAQAHLVTGQLPPSLAVGPDGRPRRAVRVRLGFATSEPLDDVAGRLGGAGFELRREGDRVFVTDPDGQPVVVRRDPPAGT